MFHHHYFACKFKKGMKWILAQQAHFTQEVRPAASLVKKIKTITNDNTQSAHNTAELSLSIQPDLVSSGPDQYNHNIITYN